MLATLPFIACASKPGPLGKKTIDITGFDFSTNISTTLPARYEYLGYEDCYRIPETASDDTNRMQCDSVRSWETNERMWVEYLRGSTSSEDQYLCFDGQIFNSANFITTLDGRIVLVSGYAYSISAQQSAALIERMTRKYGEPKITQESFCRKNYDRYA